MLKKIEPSKDGTESETENEFKEPCHCTQGKCAYHCGFANGYTIGLIKKKHNFLNQGIEDFSQKNISKYDVEDYNIGYKNGFQKGLRSEKNLVRGHIPQHTFSLADIEFGETYHIVGALVFSPESQMNVSYTCQSQMLFLLSILQKQQIFFSADDRNLYLNLEEDQKTKFKLKSNDRFEQATRMIMEMFGNFYTQPDLNTSMVTPRSWILVKPPQDRFRLFYVNNVKKAKKYENREEDDNINVAIKNLSPEKQLDNLSLDEKETVKKAIFSTRNKEAEAFILNCFTFHLKEAVPHLEERFLLYLQNKLQLPKDIMERDENKYQDKVIIAVRRVQSPSNSVSQALDGINRGEWRNLSPKMLQQVITVIKDKGIKTVILTGDIKKENEIKELREKFKDISIYDMSNFYNSSEFINIVGINSIAGQIYFYNILFKKFNVKYIVGMMSGAIDGPAFIGIPTLFFTNGDSRMINASKSIPSLIPITYDENKIKAQYSKSPKLTQFSSKELEDFSDEIDKLYRPQENEEHYAPHRCSLK